MREAIRKNFKRIAKQRVGCRKLGQQEPPNCGHICVWLFCKCVFAMKAMLHIFHVPFCGAYESFFTKLTISSDVSNELVRIENISLSTYPSFLRGGSFEKVLAKALPAYSLWLPTGYSVATSSTVTRSIFCLRSFPASGAASLCLKPSIWVRT